MSRKQKIKVTLKEAATRLSASNRLDLRAPSQLTKTLMVELLATVKALSHCYQVLHWHSKGEPFYGDHLLFERLYNAVNGEVDSVAEKTIGVTDDANCIAPSDLALRVATMVQTQLGHLQMDNLEKLIRGMYDCETVFVRKTLPKMLEDLQTAGELTDGLENFVQGICDSHESNIYLLSRRLKAFDPVEVVMPNIAPPPAAPAILPAPQMPVIKPPFQKE